MNNHDDEMVSEDTYQTSETKNLLTELEEDGPEAVTATESEIEQKYISSQAKIYIQRNDFLIPNILEMVKNRDILDLSPSYQRRMRWSDTKKSHLIESLLMNVPIPPIFLYEKQFAKYEVMDGQQRLKSVTTFYDNQFKLRGLKKWPELNGRQYVDLPPTIQAGLSRRSLAAVIILTESSQDEPTAMELRQYVFERLNTGGQRLNAQEVRNCIYSSHFNDMLIDIARHPLFTSAWGIPPKESGEPQQVSRKLARNVLYSTMADCQIVLRYFALSDLQLFRGSMQRFLDDFMRRAQENTRHEVDQMKKDYLSILQTATDIYGERLFRLTSKSGGLTGRRSVPLADVVLLGIRSNMNHADKLRERKERLIDETQVLLNNPTNYVSIVGHGLTRKALEERIKLLDGLIKRVLEP